MPLAGPPDKWTQSEDWYPPPGTKENNTELLLSIIRSNVSWSWTYLHFIIGKFPSAGEGIIMPLAGPPDKETQSEYCPPGIEQVKQITCDHSTKRWEVELNVFT